MVPDATQIAAGVALVTNIAQSFTIVPTLVGTSAAVIMLVFVWRRISAGLPRR